jgi:RNA polymerase sigma-70 factor, ECF subfamily
MITGERVLLERAQPLGGDEELVARITARDESALREAIQEHGGRVLAVAARTLRDTARAEEVVQDTFLALWNRPSTFDLHRGSLRSFLCGIAHHKAVDVVRKESARERATKRLLEGGDPSFGAISGSDAAPDVLPALKTLTPKLRETLFWAFFMGLTYREVAAELGIPEGTAKSRIRDALTHLRAELAHDAQLS